MSCESCRCSLSVYNLAADRQIMADHVAIVLLVRFGAGALVNRKVDGERAAPTWFTFDGDSPAMGLDDVFDDRQPQPAALHVMHQAVADAVELLEDLLALFAGDADAVVDHRDCDRLALFGDLDPDLF